MSTHVSDVVAGLGVMVATPALAGVCCTTIAGHALPEVLVAVVTIGVILTVLGLVSRYETQRRAWDTRTEAVLQARRQAQRLLLASVTSEANNAAQEASTAPGAHRPVPDGHDTATLAAPALG
jgi:Tfp pilus assembly protein PilV